LQEFLKNEGQNSLMTAGTTSLNTCGARPASSIQAVAPEDLKSKPVTLALRYWKRLCGARPFPSREEIKPRDMAPFLRNVVLVRVIEGGRDYEYRITGDALVQAFGIHFKGMLLSQIAIADPDYGKAAHAVYECVRNLGQPFALRRSIAPTATARFSYHETIVLPFGKDGAVDHLLTTSVFTPRVTDAEQTPLAVMLPPSWKDFAKLGAKAAA
jgi:hypothetical protein